MVDVTAARSSVSALVAEARAGAGVGAAGCCWVAVAVADGVREATGLVDSSLAGTCFVACVFAASVSFLVVLLAAGLVLLEAEDLTGEVACAGEAEPPCFTDWRARDARKENALGLFMLSRS